MSLASLGICFLVLALTSIKGKSLLFHSNRTSMYIGIQVRGYFEVFEAKLFQSCPQPGHMLAWFALADLRGKGQDFSPFPGMGMRMRIMSTSSDRLFTWF